MITPVVHRQLRLAIDAGGGITPGLFNAMRSANLTPSEAVKVMAALGMDPEGRPIAPRPVVAAAPLPAPPPAPATTKPVRIGLVAPRTAPMAIPTPQPVQIARKPIAAAKIVNRVSLPTTSTLTRTAKAGTVSKPPAAVVVVHNVVMRRKLRTC